MMMLNSLERERDIYILKLVTGTGESGTRLLKRVPILKLLEFQVVLIFISGFNQKKMNFFLFTTILDIVLSQTTVNSPLCTQLLIRSN